MTQGLGNVEPTVHGHWPLLTHVGAGEAFTVGEAFAVTRVGNGGDQFVGVGRYVVDAATLSADVALVLADAWQGRGLGRR